MNNETTITMKMPHKASHRKGQITIVRMITVMGLQKTALAMGLITETETNLMIIISGHGMEDLIKKPDRVAYN